MGIKLKPKEIFKGLLIMGVSTLFTLLLLEGMFRVFPQLLPKDMQGPRFFTYDPDIIFRLKPTFETTETIADGATYDVKLIDLGFDQGFRDDGINGTVYAVAHGDSFTWCVGVNVSDCWVEQLEKSTGKDIVNLARSGDDAVAEMKTMESYGTILRPKLYIVQFFYNDFEGAYYITHQSQPRIRAFLRENSVLFNLANYIITKYQFLGRIDYESTSSSYMVSYNDSNFSFGFVPAFWPYPGVINSTSVSHGKVIAEDAYLEMKNISDRGGAKMLVILIPSKEQIYGGLIKDKVAGYDTINFDYYSNEMKSFCAKNSITFLDLAPAFKAEAAKGKQLYFGIDQHFNNAGYSLVAQQVYSYLQAKGWLNLQ
jgi:hypothetical protein